MEPWAGPAPEPQAASGGWCLYVIAEVGLMEKSYGVVACLEESHLPTPALLEVGNRHKRMFS